MAFFLGICFLLYFLKLSAGQGFCDAVLWLIIELETQARYSYGRAWTPCISPLATPLVQT